MINLQRNARQKPSNSRPRDNELLQFTIGRYKSERSAVIFNREYRFNRKKLYILA